MRLKFFNAPHESFYVTVAYSLLILKELRADPRIFLPTLPYDRSGVCSDEVWNDYCS
jgi:hypothetical protein